MDLHTQIMSEFDHRFQIGISTFQIINENIMRFDTTKIRADQNITEINFIYNQINTILSEYKREKILHDDMP